VAKGKNKPEAPWLDKVLATGEFAGCQRGIIAMTRDPDTDEHTLWIYNVPMFTGSRLAVYAEYNNLSIDGFRH